MLSSEEKKVKQYLIDKVVPSLEEVLKEKNPVGFKRWGNNCCRQTAFICCSVLKKKLKDYTWKVNDWTFEHKESNRIYEHSFVTGINKEGKRMLVDLSRHPIWDDLFIDFKDANDPYKDTHIEDKVLKKNEYSYVDMLNEKEYFTGLQGKDLVKLVIEKANFSKEEL